MSRHRRGMGSIFTAGSDTLWIRYYLNGRPVTVNTHSRDRDVATKELQKRVYEASQGLVPDASVMRKLTAASLYEAMEREYEINGRKSVGHLKRRWKLHLAPFFGHLKPSQVSTDLVNRYIDERQHGGASNASINRELALLKRAFSLGRRCTPPKIQNVPYFQMLKEDNIRTGFLESADYDKLARECARWGLWMRTAFELGYQFGWRKSEVLGLKVCQVSIVDSTIRLNPGDTKNDEGREVSLTPNLRTLLQECIRGKRPADFVLTRKNGRPVQDFRGAWDNITAAADVPDLTFHDLRRTAARHLVRAGVPERVAMRVTGHKTRTIFDRYNITSQTDMEEAAIKLENYRLAAIRQRTVRVAPESQEVEACLQTATVPVN